MNNIHKFCGNKWDYSIIDKNYEQFYTLYILPAASDSWLGDFINVAMSVCS